MRLKLTCLGLIEARQRECSIEVDLVWVAKIPTFLQIWAHLGGTSKHASKICKGKLHLIRVSTSKGNQLQCNYAKVQYPCLLEITYYQSKSCYVYLKYQLPPSTLFLQQRLNLYLIQSLLHWTLHHNMWFYILKLQYSRPIFCLILPFWSTIKFYYNM